MILYHGTTVEVKEPQIVTRNIGRDFGPAFYTTDIRQQAERWAKRRAMIEERKGKEDALQRLQFEKINNQIAFCTEKALQSLKVIECYEVR